MFLTLLFYSRLFISLLVCLVFNSKLTGNCNDGPYHSHDICHSVSSLINVSASIVPCCVLNPKLGTVNEMSVG